MDYFLVWYCGAECKGEELKTLCFFAFRDAYEKMEELRRAGYATGIIELQTKRCPDF